MLRCWQLAVPELQPWVDKGRMLVTRVTDVKGYLVMVVIAIYGDPAGTSTAPANSAKHEDFLAMFQALEDYVISAGSSPILIAGDFNATLAEEPHLARMLECSVLFDLVAQCSDEPRLPTCSGRRVIDHVLATRALLHRQPKATQSLLRWPQDHAPIDVRLKFRAPVEVLGRFTPPQALPACCGHLLDVERGSEPWRGPLDREVFQYLLGTQQVDQAYIMWSHAWEQHLVARALASGASVDPKAIGRGTSTGFSHYVPRATAAKDDGREVMAGTNEWQRLRTRLRLLRSSAIVEPLSQEQLREVHDAAMHLSFGWHLDPVSEPCVAIDALIKEVNLRIKLAAARKRRARVDAWKISLHDFNDPSSVRSHRYLRNAWARQVTAVADADGELVTDLPSMDRIVTEAWQKVAEPKAVSLAQSRDALAVAASKLPELSELDMPPITAADLARAAKKAKSRRAPGVRGWHASDLKMLPALAWQQLADLINAGERGGSLPLEWNAVVQTLIPKHDALAGSLKPLSLRPIGVLPTLARVWARARLEVVLKHTLEAFPSSMFGGLPGKSAQQLLARVLLLIERGCEGRPEQAASLCVNSEDRRKPAFIAQLDVEKYFNGIDAAGMGEAFSKLGLGWFGQFLARHCCDYSVHNKFWGGHVGKEYRLLR
eukprot:6491576-Amphidinium_carterae.1